MTRSSGLAALACALLACSGAVHEPVPRPTSVVPGIGYASVETEIAIHGEGFRPDPYQDANGAPRADASFRAWLGASELGEVRWVSATELRARVPAGVPAGVLRLEVRDPRGAVGALDGAYTVVAGGPPALRATAALLPAIASLGQPVTLRVTVTNAGGEPAVGVGPSVSVAGEALALPPAMPAAVDLAPGETQVFQLDCSAAALGAAAIGVEVAGTDPVTGLRVAATASAGSLLVQPPSLLGAAAHATPETASLGQLVVVDVTYANAPGVAPVVGLRPAFSGTSGPGVVALVAPPPPCDVPSGGTCVATFVFQATDPGATEVDLDAAGEDANSGVPIAAPRATAAVLVQRPPALTGALVAAPARASVGQPLTVTLSVTNSGEVAASGVAASIVAAPVGADPQGAAPAPQDVPAGGTRTFAWTFAAPGPAAGAFVAAAAGEDANGAGPVTLADVLSNDVVIEARAALVATASAAPLQVSAGQAIAVALDVTNVGEAAAVVTPSLACAAAGTAGWSALSNPAAATVEGGATARFGWTAATSGSGTLSFTASADGVDANSGEPVSASGAAPAVRVQLPARLVATVAAPAVVNSGQTFTVSADVTNVGEAAAVDVSVALGATGAASVASGPLPPGPVPLGAGATQRFAWTSVAGEGPGTVAFDAAAAGADANSGAAIAATAAERAVAVQRPAALATELVAAPARVDAGQLFAVRVRVTNAGDAGALGVVPAVGCDACTLRTAPSPVGIAGGGSAEWDLSVEAGALGGWTLRASASGTDAMDGVVRTSAVVEQPLAVEQRAALAAAFRNPGIAPMAGFLVELEATNPVADPAFGQASASGVAPAPLAVVSEAGYLDPSQVSCAPRSVAPARIDAGGVAVFGWTCTAAAVGQVKLSTSLSGTDANDGSPLAAAAVGVVDVDEAAMVVSDPFGDGTPFSFVFGYDGHVFLGPSGDGRGVVRCLPDATGCQSWALSFYRDQTLNISSPPYVTSVHQNTCTPYATLGSTTPLGSPSWCNPDNPAATPCFCGPNYESGRGMFGSWVIGGNEWLVAMGRSKKRELRYLYMSRDTATPLRFSYVDVTASIPDTTVAVEDVTAMAVLNDRVYAGFQVDSADRPRMLVLNRTPVAPGLDASAADTTATVFRNTPMFEQRTGIGQASISQVDSMLGFEGRLFVANRRAVLASRTGAPDLSAADASTQFDECTPLAPATWAAGGFDYTEKIDIKPADKAVPALAAWQGRLYLARNTLANVPEIWVFTPRHDAQGAFLGCAADRSDWRRVATNFADAANVRATALFASAAYLYVGYDNATSGVKLFRTAVAAPSGEGQFTGHTGCAAPCQPVGHAGFGDATNVRFLDARAMRFGAVDQVWATVGVASGPVRVFRISE